MAFDDTFRPRSYIHERDTYDIIGKAMRVPEIKPNNFDGPVAQWADYRAAKFGDIVSPIITLPEADGDDVHRVSWVYHAQRDPETGAVSTHNHHIACDCSMMAELTDEPDSIFECSTLQKTLNRRAALFRSTLLLDKIFRACASSENGRSKTTLARQIFVAETIVWLLRQDREHPESWVGNIVSGEHSISLLGLIVQIPPDRLRPVVEDLAREGRIEYDGEQTVKLAA